MYGVVGLLLELVYPCAPMANCSGNECRAWPPIPCPGFANTLPRDPYTTGAAGGVVEGEGEDDDMLGAADENAGDGEHCGGLT